MCRISWCWPETLLARKESAIDNQRRIIVGKCGEVVRVGEGFWERKLVRGNPGRDSVSSLLILTFPGGTSGEGREQGAEPALVIQRSNAMGHSEIPLAEVFSQMPRCAPLRLSSGE